jgi:hypothetical protein
MNIRRARLSARAAAALGAALLVVAAACDSGVDPIDPSLSAAVITRDGTDVYGLTVTDEITTAAARSTNQGGNTRVVFWRNADPVSTDQEVCTTWTAADQDQQPGLALRAHAVDGGTQVITVTKNIWLIGYSIFNVHVMDSSNPDEPFVRIASQDLPGLRNSSAFYDVKPYPWRACARAVGTTISLKVWPLSEPEPAWDDPNYGYSVTLGPEWEVTAGNGGSYIGHLPAGATIGYSDHVVTNLDAPSASPAAAEALAEPTVPPDEPTHVLSAP